MTSHEDRGLRSHARQDPVAPPRAACSAACLVPCIINVAGGHHGPSSTAVLPAHGQPQRVGGPSNTGRFTWRRQQVTTTHPGGMCGCCVDRRSLMCEGAVSHSWGDIAAATLGLRS
eukprot:271184-Chlamydomonas_euryale.AAC.1